MDKDLMLAKAGIEELSQLLQVALQSLNYIAQPAVGRVAKDPATTVARQSLARIKELREANNGVKEKILSGEIAGMDSPSKKPPRIQLADRGEITFDRDHDLYFHQCCDCGLIHEVETDWQDDITGSGGQFTSLVTRWTRRDNTPTLEEMKARGIEVSEV